MRFSSPVLAVLPALVAALCAGADALPWVGDWKLARERAAADGKPLLIVVMKDEEPGCDRMLRTVYADPAVRESLARFVLVPASAATHDLIEIERRGERVPSCSQFVGALCSEHQAVERELHAQLVEPGSDEVLAPQHLVLDAKGEVLLRRPYEMRRQGFLEFLECGLAYFADPAERTRPGIHSEFVRRLAEAVVKARDADARRKAAVELLAENSPEREFAFLELFERVSGAANQEPIVRAAGYPQHRVWAPTVAKLLETRDARVRDCAVVTLEEEVDPSVGPALLALWEKETDAETKKDLLRALGPCGARRPEVRALLLVQLDAAKDPWRSAAALSLGWFAKGDEEVAAALETRYAREKSALVRLACLAACFRAGDAARRDRIVAMTKSEREKGVASFAELLHARLDSAPDEPAGGAPPAGPSIDRAGAMLLFQSERLLAPLYAADKVVRNRVRDFGQPQKPGKRP